VPLIAMNREMGSLGKDVARGLEKALGLKVRHHEIIDHLASRARIRKSHVLSFLEGTQGLLERLTIDEIVLRILTADEILSLAVSNGGVILRGWGATSLLKGVPHAVRVCVTAPRALRIKRMMQRLSEDDPCKVAQIVDQNDEAAGAVMRRHFHVDLRDINEYDLSLNTERISVGQCVERIVDLVNSEQFAETEESRARLRHIAVEYQLRAALRTHAPTSRCKVRVSAEAGRVTLRGIVEGDEQRRACASIAERIKGITALENLLQVAEVPVRLRGGG
jgi:cytidylate kinase